MFFIDFWCNNLWVWGVDVFFMSDGWNEGGGWDLVKGKVCVVCVILIDVIFGGSGIEYVLCLIKGLLFIKVFVMWIIVVGFLDLKIGCIF